MLHEHTMGVSQGAGHFREFQVALPMEQVRAIARYQKSGDPRPLNVWLALGLNKMLKEAQVRQPSKRYRDVSALHAIEVELFAALAEDAPKALRGPWALVYERIRNSDRYWLYPTCEEAGEPEEGMPSASAPCVNRDALSCSWTLLLDDAQTQLSEAQW
jgi:hypothetical protein